MEDRIIATDLERADALDFNNMQALQARRLGEVQITAYADHAITLPGDAQSTDVVGKVREVVTGLHVRDGGSTGIYITPGTLAVPWVPNGDEGIARVGILRTITHIPYVSTGRLPSNPISAFHLLIARPSDVAKEYRTIDIWNETTQQFEPSYNQPKTIVTSIEFSWIIGVSDGVNGTVWPSLDSIPDGWYPIAYVNFAYGGTANDGQNMDVARRVEGRENGWSDENSGTSNVYAPPPIVQTRLRSEYSPCYGDPYTISLVGTANGVINGERVFWSSLQDASQRCPIDGVDGSLPVKDYPIHYYLCPITGSGTQPKIAWPVKSKVAIATKQNNVSRGLLIASTIQPLNNLTNSAPITLYETSTYATGPRGKYANLSAVPSGKALYVGSAIALANGQWVPYPFVQSIGGVTTFPKSYEDGNPFYGSFLATFGDLTLSGSALDDYQTLDLNTRIPNAATAVYLDLLPISATNLEQAWSFSSRRTGPDYMRAEIHGSIWVPTNARGYYGGTQTVRVPVGWAITPSHLEWSNNPEYHRRIYVTRSTIATSGNTGAFRLYLKGWEL